MTHRRAINLLVFGVSSVVTLVGFELVASLINHLFLPDLNHVLLDDGLMEFSPRYFWQLREGVHTYGGSTVTINSRHVRSAWVDWSEKPESEYRILFLGDSSVFGHGVNDDETFAEVCQRLCQRSSSDKRIRVINAGVPGYSSFQAHRWLSDNGSVLKPDLIVVATLFSDCMTWIWTDQALALYVTPVWRSCLYKVKELSRKTQVGKLAAYVYRTANRDRIKDRELIPWESLVTTGGMREQFRVPREDYQANLNNILAEAKVLHARVIGLVLPTLEEVTTGEPSHQHLALYKETLHNVITGAGYPCLDLVPIFTRHTADRAAGGDLFIDGLHPSPRGHTVIAEALVAVIGQEFALTPSNEGRKDEN